jgi:hypothetical protein
MKDAVKSLKSSILRFPGGAEASSYLWATAPSWSPKSHAPAFKTSAHWPNNDGKIVQNGKFVDVVNFDEFMSVAGHADVCIVVNFDSMYASGGPSKRELIETARQWVRYSKKFSNKFYWEIGNESDMDTTYNGRPHDGTQYGKDFVDFAVAMRKEDSDAKIGMNGYHEIFMTDVLKAAGKHVDFVALHPYPIWGYEKGFSDYVSKGVDVDVTYNRLQNALLRSSLSKSKRDSMFVLATETGVMDWATVGGNSPGWPGNNVGKMLALCDVLGQLAMLPRVRGVLGWTSHWVERTEDTDSFFAFDPTNAPTPVGHALFLWASLGDCDVVSRKKMGSVVTYVVDTKSGQKKIVINASDHDIVANALVAFHGDVNSSVVKRTEKILPQKSIGIVQ